MKIKRLVTTIVCIMLAVAAHDVAAEQEIRQFSGNSSGNTAEFEVRAPWVMDWLVSGDPGQYEVVSIALVNAISGAYEGVALKTKTAGNGVRLFDKGGRFYFRVDASMMNWKIKVIQLTAEEAKQYRPKTQRSMLDQ
jgi:hypothetical protein